ncbi:DUF1761 domain-containing protein [Lewinella sp. 4G2]|uniref:DUF1761 domain-containing protein n=1 Tax=Lewinella sp. 4G2 TaxID=1803372 RepID=UPI0007B493F9|nr:DUF1761 domain-containing protein [Lewinella sp. 4G2]OAV46212.1 hypothetical protein A3850_018325 [Lewinella sp. 4G2]
MIPNNPWLLLLVGLIPLLVGALYYSPIGFHKAWMKANNFTEADLEGANMVKIFGLAYLYGVILASFLPSLVMHQTGLSGIFGMLPEWADKSSALWTDLNAMDDKWGMFSRHLHFGHGVMHGIVSSVFLVVPIVSINSLFERRGWKYAAIHIGYWTICLALMGGVLCEFLELPL